MSRAEKFEEQNRQVQEVLANTSDEAEQLEKISSFRDWFRPESNSPYYPIIKAYLEDQIDINGTTEQLFRPIDSKISEERLDDVNFTDLWHSVLLCARQAPFRQEDKHAKVLDIVSAFKNHSIPGNEKYNYLYSALTDFSLACREAYNDVPDPSNAVAVENKAWASLNYFYALVTVKGVADLSLFAIWAMREALEYDYADDEQGTAAQQYDTHVPAAAGWVFSMHTALYEKEEDLTPKERNKGNPAKGGDLWKGKAEFSKRRWALWKARFAEVGNREDVSQSTKLVARDAVQSMERAATFEKVSG